MSWYEKVKSSLSEPSLRGFKAEFSVMPPGENWDGIFYNRQEAEQEMRKLETGWICLWKYQGALYRGGDLIEDVSDNFEFEVLNSNKSKIKIKPKIIEFIEKVYGYPLPKNKDEVYKNIYHQSIYPTFF